MFDEHADAYVASLHRGLCVTGEDASYYARGRLRWLLRCLDARGATPRRVLDFGCGIGGTSPLFLEWPEVREVVGVDESWASIERARRQIVTPSLRFESCDRLSDLNPFDLVYCNGVFHHIASADRLKTLLGIGESMKPGAWFAFWENNPWNPGTRYVMSRIPFDRDAVLLSARSARRLLTAAGFTPLATHYLFIFPRCMGAFRVIEPWLVGLPAGGQYQILCRKADR